MHTDAETRAYYEWIALRCQAGEPDAFEDLIAVMERPLLYYAATLTGSQDSGLDVLQDVWVKALRGIHKLKDPGSLRSWLYTMRSDGREEREEPRCCCERRRSAGGAGESIGEIADRGLVKPLPRERDHDGSRSATTPEEVASMLAKHNKGLTAEKWSNYILGACVVWLLAVSNSTWGPNLDSTAQHVLQVFAAVFFFLLGVGSLKVYNHRNQMEVLKEVKQVQLQVLELQASLRKDGAE
jgi:hypothetical protein